jgi:nitrogen regulatory protein P-II 1
MKEIKAVIQPSKLEKIRNAFRNLKQFPGMTVLKAQGCSSNDKTPTRRVDPLDELNDFSNKTMIILLCPDHLVEGVLQIIAECASTGQKGDGLVWVTEAARVIRLDEKIAVMDEPPMFHAPK